MKILKNVISRHPLIPLYKIYIRFGASCENLEAKANDDEATSSNGQQLLHLQTSGETNVSESHLLDDFSHFLQPGPFLTSEEAVDSSGGGIDSVRTRLEEIQDQVRTERFDRVMLLFCQGHSVVHEKLYARKKSKPR